MSASKQENGRLFASLDRTDIIRDYYAAIERIDEEERLEDLVESQSFLHNFLRDRRAFYRQSIEPILFNYFNRLRRSTTHPLGYGNPTDTEMMERDSNSAKFYFDITWENLSGKKDHWGVIQILLSYDPTHGEVLQIIFKDSLNRIGRDSKVVVLDKVEILLLPARRFDFTSLTDGQNKTIESKVERTIDSFLLENIDIVRGNMVPKRSWKTMFRG